MLRKTKTICTIGPSSQSEEKIRELIKAGMNVVRCNFSHGDFEEHGGKIVKARKVAKELGTHVAVMLDTKGPEVRTGEFDGKIQLEAGQKFTFVNKTIMGTKEQGCTTYKDLYKFVKPGNRILISDGLVEMEVKTVEGEDIICEVVNDGMIQSRRNFHVVGVNLDFPAFTDKDKEDILWGIKNDVDYIAASFVRTASDVKQIRELLDNNGGERIKIIAKVESQKGVECLDEIIEAADGIMVARGDLAVDVPLHQVPRIQKRIIKSCAKAGKIAVVATQMLDSMVNNPRPTRAEVSDVANAVYDGATAVMLSAESANGDYPVEALSTMVDIIKSTEESIDYKKRFRNRRYNPDANIVNAVSHAACETATDVNAKAILALTKSGHTANLVSNYHPATDIIGISSNEQVANQMSLLWGVKPIYIGKEITQMQELINKAIEISKESKLVQKDDVVILTLGTELKQTDIMNVTTIK